MQNQIIIFSGFNQRAVISFIRTLEKNNIKYVIVAASKTDTILNTVYKDKVAAIRRKIQLNIDDFTQTIGVVKEKTQCNSFLVAPSTEALNRFLLEHRDLFKEKGITVPLIEKELYEQISDKYTFCKLCQKYAIRIPKEEILFEKINLPFVAKPYSYFNKSGKVFIPQLIYTEHEKKTFIENFDLSDFYYQQYISGKSYYLLYYIDQNRNIYKYSQENIAQQPDGKSIVAAISSSMHNKNISDKYEQMLCSLNFRGLIMIEIKEEDGKYYMIEANPRFWGPSQLFVDSKMNFFELFLWDYGLTEKIPKLKPIGGKYFWHGGISQTVNKGQKLTIYSDNFDISSEKALNEWLKYDIYKREDTYQIYNNELLTI